MIHILTTLFCLNRHQINAPLQSIYCLYPTVIKNQCQSTALVHDIQVKNGWLAKYRVSIMRTVTKQGMTGL